MTTIIAGNFQRQDQARAAIVELERAGFPAAQTSTFFVNPPGQHALYPFGGDEDESPGTEDAAGRSATGAAVGAVVGAAVGLATLPMLGSAAAVAGAGVGAFAGSLYGALGHTHDRNNPETQAAREELRHGEPPRKSGMLVAVSAPVPAQQASAIRILRAQGAADIEQSEGTITSGQWSDFNPLKPMTPVVSR